jgi:taurine dioxygenase
MPKTSASDDAAAASGITVTPLSVHIGAEIGGVDLSQPLSGAAVEVIRAALLRWKVVFFRDQSLDHTAHVRMARCFGRPTPAHVVFGGHDDAFPEVYSIAKHRTANAGRPPLRRIWTDWHTDITAAVNPPWASILRGDIVPPYGGDTHWTNLALAYERLSPTLRGFLDGLRAIHRFSAPGDPNDADYAARTHEQNLVADHPLIAVHPETGERVLYVSPGFVTDIAGLAPRESQALLEMLWEHAVQTEFTIRFKWEPGSVAFWDNRATAHLAPTDIFATDFDRQFYRVTLNGEPLTGVDGALSNALSGDPIEAV